MQSVEQSADPDVLRGVAVVAEFLAVPVPDALALIRRGYVEAWSEAGVICARRSALTAWFVEAEAKQGRR